MKISILKLKQQSKISQTFRPGTSPVRSTIPPVVSAGDSPILGTEENPDTGNQQPEPTPKISTDTYTVFEPSDIVTNSKQTITSGLWSGDLASLTTLFTSSTQTISQRRYYVDIYDDNPNNDGAATQFSIAYGHALGSGSSNLGTEENPASRAIYSQYRNLLLEKNANRFITENSGSTDSIYVINIKRNRVKERLDEGNFELPLVDIGSRDLNATGSVSVGSSIITLIDDSSESNATFGSSGRVYNIVSGSLSNGVYNTSAPDYYGLFYPDYGIMVLDGNVLDQQLAFDTNITSDSEGSNHFSLFHSISGSNIGFQARNSQQITSANYFVRVKNGQYNFSNNPSYTTGSDGLLSQSDFIGNPKSYITTIGLYNERNELLAVSKLSKPILKSFEREQLIRVKLDY